MPIDLYHINGSPPCRSVRMGAKALGLELNLKEVNLMAGEHLKPEFLKLNPLHQVPTLVDDGFVVFESRAILAYLANKYAPDSPLYPKDPQKRSLVDRILFFDSGTLHAAFSSYFRPMVFKGEAPTPERTQAVDKALEALQTILGDQKFLAGPNLTLADISVAAVLSQTEATEYDVGKFEKLKEYKNRLASEIPGYHEINDSAIQQVRQFLQEKLKK